MKTADFGVPCAAVPQPGVCRICSCTEDNACVLDMTDAAPDGRPCGWADETRTLCDSPKCIAAAKRELGLDP